VEHYVKIAIIRLIVSVFVLLPISVKAQIPSLTTRNGRIAFASNQDGDYEIYTMNANGSDIMQLTHNDVEDKDPNWSPDGSQIVYTSYSGEGSYEVYVMNSDGTNQRDLSNSSEPDFDPDWSPDGNRIAFISFRSRSPLLVPNIFTISPDGSNLSQITYGQGEVGGNFYQPSWSSDGQHLTYLMGEVGGSAIGSIDSFRLFTIDLGTLTPLSLPANPAFNNVDWSPEGQTIIFESISLTEEIQAVSANGTNYRTVSSGFEGYNNPSWSPDGQQIVFEISGRDIGIMDSNGQNVVNLTNSPDVGEIDPHWQPILPIPPTD
jgi:Tol biopolymer transport system component